MFLKRAKFAEFILKTNTTTVTNTSSSETDLITFSVPAATLRADGDQIEFEFVGATSSGFGNIQIKAKFGGTTLVDSGAMSVSGAIAAWKIFGRIIRTGATTQRAICTFTCLNTSLVHTTTYSTPAETLANAITIKATSDVDDMMMGGMSCSNYFFTSKVVPAN